MSPILCLIASCLMQAAPHAADARPPADPVIGWARVEFDADDITSAEAGGHADLETGRPVTVDDPVRIASVSKFVVALAVAKLVEAGTLDLREDVSAYLGWELRNPAFPDRRITLRHLLGHRAGIRDAAGYALPLDADLEEWMTRGGAWNAEHAPGEWFSYANLNFPIVAAAMEGATGERFDRLMARQVFEPLGIDACFNWTTCSAAARSRAVVLYRPDGSVARDSQRAIGDDCPAIPAGDGSCDHADYVLARNGAAFSPQGGLRISARGLARIGRLFLGSGDEDGFGFLRRHYRDMPMIPMLYGIASRPITEAGDSEGGVFCRYDNGTHTLRGDGGACDDNLFAAGDPYGGHSGEAYSLRSGLWVSSEAGRGVAYFATGCRKRARCRANRPSPRSRSGSRGDCRSRPMCPRRPVSRACSLVPGSGRWQPVSGPQGAAETERALDSAIVSRAEGPLHRCAVPLPVPGRI